MTWGWVIFGICCGIFGAMIADDHHTNKWAKWVTEKQIRDKLAQSVWEDAHRENAKRKQ